MSLLLKSIGIGSLLIIFAVSSIDYFPGQKVDSVEAASLYGGSCYKAGNTSKRLCSTMCGTKKHTILVAQKDSGHKAVSKPCNKKTKCTTNMNLSSTKCSVVRPTGVVLELPRN
jgi:hypothetical protein